MTLPFEPIDTSIGRRAWMAGIGALAGLAAWLLLDVLPDRVDSERALLFLTAASGGFFVCLLAAAGTLPVVRAVAAAAAASLPGAVLLTWASLRYRDVESFLETGHAPAAFFLIVVLSLPYLMVANREGENWRNYPALFKQAWEIVIRFAAAAIFLGLFWAVVFLSDALFGLVGLEFIGDLLNLDPVPPILTGAVAGLALAVVAELGDYISPYLILRLLRLFLPVVLVVTVVFLAALPVQGVSGLFGGLSATAVLLAMAVGIATLITAAVERFDDLAADSPMLRASAQLLALAMPVLSGLALYAVWLRMNQYGLSPDRIAAGCASVVALGYGLVYAVSVLLRRGWMAKIRQANLAMALVTVAVAALWLTPILNAERLSARDQIARLATGALGADEIDLWFLGRELGVIGDEALAELAAIDHADGGALAARIALLQAAGSRFDFERSGAAVRAAEDRDWLLETVPVRPEGALALAVTDLAGVSPSQLSRWATACREEQEGGLPGCVLLRVDLLPGIAGNEALFFWQSPGGVRILALFDGAAKAPMLIRGAGAALPPDTIRRILDGEFSLGVPALKSVGLGDVEIILLP